MLLYQRYRALGNDRWFFTSRVMNETELGGILMKSTGIVRKVDELGRVVIPIELRRVLDIEVKDALEIYTDDDTIILKKYKPTMTCDVTGDVSDKNMRLADGRIILSEEGAKLLMDEIQSKMK
jgi:transcriptional pleiotropic regulator of transition state genes